MGWVLRMIKIHISHTGEGETEQGCRREEGKRQIWEGVSETCEAGAEGSCRSLVGRE